MHEFDAFLDDMRLQALAAGLPAESFAEWTAALAPDDRVIQRSANQPEHIRTASDYVSNLVSDARIAQGRNLQATHSNLLARINDRYGVPAPILMAIWGIESNYGQGIGTCSVLRSLATLAAIGGRRAAFWREQFLAALTILHRGDVTTDQLVGSWAAAMGQTQFMPTTYLEHAVDFDGDGRRDIWQSVADALASAANYLDAAGWIADVPWGWEVSLPAGFDYLLAGQDEPRPLAFWTGAGVLPATTSATNGQCTCTLVLPAGSAGPAFLATPNLQCLLIYNNAMAYALSVGHLADRIAGLPPIAKEWPSEQPLDTEQRRELQQRLVALGYDTGGVDGILGRASRRAVQKFQQHCDMVPDGYPNRVVLEELRRSR
ncbi:MAG: lytic murein transglycosylase [Hyphomicrobiaceae bacterium]